jgi:hypothetical protein
VILAALLLVQANPAEALRDELASARSATAVLQRRCATPIRAEVDRVAAKPATAVQRARLKVGADEPITYRSVTLKCGDVALSVADNWYVPARLTPEMNAALAGDAPFGAVIRPLAPSRRTLLIALYRIHGKVAPTRYVLNQDALVIAGDGQPLAEVVENYTPVLLCLPVLTP